MGVAKASRREVIGEKSFLGDVLYLEDTKPVSKFLHLLETKRPLPAQITLRRDDPPLALCSFFKFARDNDQFSKILETMRLNSETRSISMRLLLPFSSLDSCRVWYRTACYD